MKKIDIHLHPPAAGSVDLNMDEYIERMDRYDVAAGLVHGVPDDGVSGRGNDSVLRLMKAHPRRLFGSAFVDLLSPLDECIAEVRRRADEGFVCVKLFPNYGYDPNDEAFEPFWQVVEDLGLMCLSHCGWLVHRPETAAVRKQSLTATPLHFEVPARRHEGINFIFAHFGGGASYLETVTLLSRLPNCYADTCPGWGKWVWEQRMPGLGGLDFSHVLYGTDNMSDPEGYAKDEYWWTKTFTSMSRTEADVERFFYRNAAGLLGIE